MYYNCIHECLKSDLFIFTHMASKRIIRRTFLGFQAHDLSPTYVVNYG